MAVKAVQVPGMRGWLVRTIMPGVPGADDVTQTPAYDISTVAPPSGAHSSRAQPHMRGNGSDLYVGDSRGGTQSGPERWEDKQKNKNKTTRGKHACV